MARAAPLDMELEATTCGSALSKDAVNGVFRAGTGREGPGIVIRVSGLVHTIDHITYTAADGEAERDV